MNPNIPASRQGLAIACFVTGLLALLLSLFLIGGLLGLAGLALGIAHLAQKQSRNRLAWAGIWLSAIGVGASVGFAMVYIPMIKKSIAQQGQAPAFTQWQGVPAPDFSLTTLTGEHLKLSDLKGKRVIVDFWATWCPPCVAEIPHFIQLRSETPGTDLFIVGISNEDADKLSAFVRDKGVNYPIATEPDLPAPYNTVTAIPTTFFIDRHGVIQEMLVGLHTFDELKRLALAADFAGEPRPAPPAKSSEADGKKP